MNNELMDDIEKFLAEGGDPDDRLRSADGTPVYGTFTFEEMRAKFGDGWAEDFTEQFKGITGLDLV